MTRPRVTALAPRLAALAALAVVIVVVYSLVSAGRPGYVVYAKFTDASGLLTAYNVKIGGVKAGTVTSIGLDRQDHAVVKMALDHGAYPVGAGATAQIRPVNLLGEKYIDLHPGSLSSPQPSGTTIPISHTGTPVELDDVLNTLDPDTLARLQIIVNETGVALAGNGANFSQTLEQLPPALDQARAFVGQIAQQNAQLGRLIDAGSGVISSVNARRGDLENLISSAADTMQTVVARRRQLAQTVQNAPGALAQLTHTLNDLGTTAGALYPAMVQLRAASPPLASVLARAPSFATDAQTALVATRDLAPLLVRLGRLATPLLERVIPTVHRLATFAPSLQTVMTGLDQQGSLKAVLRFVAGWAGVIGQRDGIGNMFRVHVALSPQLVTSVLQRMSGGAAGPPPARRPPARAAATTRVASVPQAKASGSSAAPQATAPGSSAPAGQPAIGGGGSAPSGALQGLLSYLMH
jgi:phospholipid/cholesterol/gamma-HCH transport system substrate-binding protein